MEPACSLLDAELVLDALEAELALDLPAHVRAFARAYAAGAPEPAAPPIVRRPSTVTTARRALVHPELADRALALLRLAVPVAIEDDIHVAIARATTQRDWDAYETLVHRRDAAAHARFGMRHVELMHALHGSRSDEALLVRELPPRIPGWLEPDGERSRAEIDALWIELATSHGGALGNVQILVGTDVRPRAFVVEPGREVIVALPARVTTPADRFAVLHELGHAIAALASAMPLPRVVDEAAAAYVARAMERPLGAWTSALAAPARARRLRVAQVLDGIERGGVDAMPPTERPPWALWHDPGAQAAYVAAEALAERWAIELGERPAPGAFARALRAAHAEVDHISQRWAAPVDRATTLR